MGEDANSRQRQGHLDSGAAPAPAVDLLPALAHAFERHTERALRQGLLQGYRATEEMSSVVRGRIHEADQIRRHLGRALPVELTYDEFTTDIPESQLLRAASERLLRLPGIPGPVRARLLHHRARLADTTPLVRGHELPRWQPTRLNTRYQHSLQLAELILRGTSVEHLAGSVRIEGFLLAAVAAVAQQLSCHRCDRCRPGASDRLYPGVTGCQFCIRTAGRFSGSWSAAGGYERGAMHGVVGAAARAVEGG